MKKIFYNPKTLIIQGMSDGDNSMEFPYIETAENYHSTIGLEIKIIENQPVLRIKEMNIEDIIKKEEAYIKRREERREIRNVEELKTKIKGVKGLESLKNLLIEIIS